MTDLRDEPRRLGEVVVPDRNSALRPFSSRHGGTSAAVGALVDVVVMDERRVVKQLDGGGEGGRAKRLVARADPGGQLNQLGPQALTSGFYKAAHGRGHRLGVDEKLSRQL